MGDKHWLLQADQFHCRRSFNEIAFAFQALEEQLDNGTKASEIEFPETAGPECARTIRGIIENNPDAEILQSSILVLFDKKGVPLEISGTAWAFEEFAEVLQSVMRANDDKMPVFVSILDFDKNETYRNSIESVGARGRCSVSADNLDAGTLVRMLEVSMGAEEAASYLSGAVDNMKNKNRCKPNF